MAIISLGKIDKNLIPILVGCVFCFLSRLLNTNNGTTFFEEITIVNIIAAISKLLNIIPIIIIQIRSKKVHSSSIENKNNTNISIPTKFTKMNKTKGKWLYILLTAIIFFAQSVLFLYTVSMRTNYWIWDILFTAIFYYFIFKIKLYRHHYLSIIIIISTDLIIELALGNIQNDFSEDVLSVLLRLLREVLLSLHHVINNYIMIKKFVSEYEMSLYIGILTIVFFGLFALFAYFVLSVGDYDIYSNYLDNINILEAIGLMVSQLGMNLSGLFTEKNNTPCHIFIIYAFGQLAYFIRFTSVSDAIIFIGFIFILFVSLIFNEIIELNFCGLSKNIKRNIMFRAESEDFNIGHNYLIETSDKNYIIHSDELSQLDNESQDTKKDSQN